MSRPMSEPIPVPRSHIEYGRAFVPMQFGWFLVPEQHSSFLFYCLKAQFVLLDPRDHPG